MQAKYVQFLDCLLLLSRRKRERMHLVLVKCRAEFLVTIILETNHEKSI
jgi:hypothetical protein